eukprot:9315368-Pyramimonas_sp.AAC.1
MGSQSHAHATRRAFGGAPCRATKRVRGVPGWRVEPLANAAGAVGGAPYAATNRVRGVPTWVWRTHAGDCTGSF